MQYQLKKRNSWFVTIPIVVGAVGYLWFVFFPTAKIIQDARNEIHEKEAFIAQSESLHRSVVQMENEVAEARQFTRDWRASSATIGHLSKLLGKITNQVRAAGATATRLDPQPEVVLDTVRRVPVQMELTGSASQIFRVLSLLEQLPETIWVDEVKLEKSGETAGNIQGQLKLEIFAVDLKKSD
jgi:Tfp pilus assembly protein PilO